MTSKPSVYRVSNETMKARDRTRELEAELAALHERYHDKERAHAADHADWEREKMNLEAEVERLKARVAELEAELRLERDTGSHEELCPYKAEVERIETQFPGIRRMVRFLTEEGGGRESGRAQTLPPSKVGVQLDRVQSERVPSESRSAPAAANPAALDDHWPNVCRFVNGDCVDHWDPVAFEEACPHCGQDLRLPAWINLEKLNELLAARKEAKA